jgi:hypothetical protein
MKQGSLMGCSYSVRKSEPLEVEYDGGIIRGHAYSILDVREFKHLRFLKIRNPWGKKEWTGPWADFGPEWERLRENYPDAPDWMVNYRSKKKLLKNYTDTQNLMVNCRYPDTQDLMVNCWAFFEDLDFI